MVERSVSSLLKASLLPLVFVYWLLPPSDRSLLDVPCLFTALFGFHCPGCGMKAAIIQLLGLDWRGAISTNPLAPGALGALTWVSLKEVMDFTSKRGVTRDRIFHHRAADDDERAVA